MTNRAHKADAHQSRILHKALTEMMDAGGTDDYRTAVNLNDFSEDVVERYGFETVEALADIREPWFDDDVSEPVEITDAEELKHARELIAQGS